MFKRSRAFSRVPCSSRPWVTFFASQVHVEAQEPVNRTLGEDP
jgi:hypothetical protein